MADLPIQSENNQHGCEVGCHLLISGTVTYDGIFYEDKNSKNSQNDRGRGHSYGRSSYQNRDRPRAKKVFNFVSTFMLVTIQDQWKIVSETTRLTEKDEPVHL